MKTSILIMQLIAAQIPNNYWNDNGIYTQKPPIEFQHEPTKPFVEIQGSLRDIGRLCDPINAYDHKIDGCAINTADEKQNIRFLVMYVNATKDEKKILDKILIDPAKPWIIIIPKPDDFGIRENGLTAHVRAHEIGHINGWVHQ